MPTLRLTIDIDYPEGSAGALALHGAGIERAGRVLGIDAARAVAEGSSWGLAAARLVEVSQHGGE